MLLFALLLVSLATADLAAEASRALREGRNSEAVELYATLIDGAARPPAVYFLLRATALERMKEYSQAADDLNHAGILARRQDSQTHADQARTRLEHLCLSVCSLQCSQVYSKALSKSVLEKVRRQDRAFRNAAELPHDKLIELVETCSRDPELPKILLVNQFRHGADVYDVSKTIERLAQHSRGSRYSLQSLLDLYEIVGLLQKGEFAKVTTRAKKALALDPDDQVLGRAFRIAKGISEGVGVLKNATPITQRPASQELSRLHRLAVETTSQVDLFFEKAMSDAHTLIKDTLGLNFRPRFQAAASQVRGALQSIQCVTDLYRHREVPDTCQFSDEMLEDTSKELRVSEFNKHLLALIYALRTRLLLSKLDREGGHSLDAEDDLSMAQRMITYAHSLAIEVRSPALGDIDTIDDQVLQRARHVVNPNFYRILGVSRDTPLASIKRAYYRLAKEYHPDRTPADASPEERTARQRRFQRIAEAWAVLGDEERRREYDAGRYRQEEMASHEQARQRRRLMTRRVQTGEAPEPPPMQFPGGADAFRQFQQFFQFAGGPRFFRA